MTPAAGRSALLTRAGPMKQPHQTRVIRMTIIGPQILANNIDLMTFDVISHLCSGAEVGSTRRTGSRLLASVQPQVLPQLGKEDNVNEESLEGFLYRDIILRNTLEGKRGLLSLQPSQKHPIHSPFCS